MRGHFRVRSTPKMKPIITLVGGVVMGMMAATGNCPGNLCKLIHLGVGNLNSLIKNEASLQGC